MGAKSAWEGLKTFWGALSSGGHTWTTEVAAPAAHSDKVSLVTLTLGGHQLGSGCCLERRSASGLGPPVLAQDQWQWPSLASPLIPGSNEAFLVVCPPYLGPALSPRPCRTLSRWPSTHLHDPCPHSQHFLLLTQLLRQVSIQCPVLEGTACTNCICPSPARALRQESL